MRSSLLTPHPSPAKLSCGFTLLELLVVIVIVTVLAGMVVPGIGNRSGRDVADAAERMMLLISQAQQEAVLSSQIWQVVFDPVVHSYHFRHRSGADFEAVTLAPFAGDFMTPTVSLDELEINGQLLTTPGEVFLFPTGEQDSFSLAMRAGDHEYRVSMGPVGPVQLEAR